MHACQTSSELQAWQQKSLNPAWVLHIWSEVLQYLLLWPQGVLENRPNQTTMMFKSYYYAHLQFGSLPEILIYLCMKADDAATCTSFESLNLPQQ